ncbi:RsmB/NOP family class I SAM-dependent RNA methyltransferase [Candidatus Phycosocius spiralis]|uniref:rRNA methyltransferase n=1 Tax=Candidatus Phycosocius spiralis TaxID=2815099 RepID=A0ABQ4PV19_9PROT|nr:transcription antitermination factor NusB [Candidatus Phycosocius spiralis]GIU66785.1 rRNA methyltransferase [Candidatus Phycosocius spiralis]
MPLPNATADRNRFRKPKRQTPLVNPDPARFAAVCMVSHVIDQRWTLEEAMRREQSFVGLDGRDRGFAAHLTLVTLRALGIVDAVLATKLARPLPDSAHFAKALLRVGAAQLIEGLAPPHAAVGRAVDLAKFEATGRGFAGLVNAVLRAIATEPYSRPHDRERVPALWWNRWRSAYGAETADAIASSLAQQPALDLSHKGDGTIIAKAVGGDLLPTGSIRLRETPSDVTALPLWGEGNYWVQDGAAALPAKLLATKRGETVLDMCAAPGGKTLQLAATGARVTALDVDSARINKVAENLARTALTAQLMVADARQFDAPESFDAVLLDAPCSATGTLRRNPEALWIKTPSHVARFAQTQAELILTGAQALKPGGRLVYAVCSLEPEEAQSGVQAAQESGLVVSPIKPDELPKLEQAITKEGYVRIFPSYWGELGGLDGFFIARFNKT